MRDITNSKGKIFRHFKGDLYLVEDFVTHSATQEKMVLYRALYGNCGLFVRPYDMFLEEVPLGKENPTGQKYRFERMKEEYPKQYDYYFNKLNYKEICDYIGIKY